MLEVVPFDDVVTCVKTSSEQGGEAFFWVYSYLVGETLIDAGCANAASDMAAFASERTISKVLVSHAHEDHYGCCSVLEKTAEILAMEADHEIITNPPAYGELFRTVWGQPAPASEVHSMPESIDEGDIRLETIPLPGHWPSMVGFYEPVRKWLFSADAVPLPSKKKIGMPEENIPQMIATMQRVLEMDISVLFDGHRGPIKDVRKHVQMRIDHLRDLQEKARLLHEAGKSIAQIQKELELEGPWYMEMTENRFGIDILLRSLVFDNPEG